MSDEVDQAPQQDPNPKEREGDRSLEREIAEAFAKMTPPEIADVMALLEFFKSDESEGIRSLIKREGPHVVVKLFEEGELEELDRLFGIHRNVPAGSSGTR